MDIVLAGDQDHDDRVLFSIITTLEDLPLPHTFDISTYPAPGSKELRAAIERDGVLFYERGKDSAPS